MTGADLTRAELRGACLDHANLNEACLAQADLGAASLKGAVLREAVLDNCILSLTQLESASLEAARLRGALFWGTRFSANTRLCGADLSGAAFKDVDLSVLQINPADLAGSFGDASVKLPDGLTPGIFPLTSWSSQDLVKDNGPDPDAFTRVWQAQRAGQD